MGIRDEILKIEIAEGFKHALEKNFQRLRENARREWQSRFAGTDPSDSCVRVRTIAMPQPTSSAVPAAGLIACKERPQTAKMRPLLV
jgi:hypothetical protein